MEKCTHEWTDHGWPALTGSMESVQRCTRCGSIRVSGFTDMRRLAECASLYINPWLPLAPTHDNNR